MPRAKKPQAVPVEETVPDYMVAPLPCDNCENTATVFDRRPQVSPAQWCEACAPDNVHTFS